ncbi:hypothetical protein GLU60_01780 [Nanohaloarchaea archaeon H01]|nr:hypothetical protein [Nanohaloarchaea archaeon H01]
MRLYEHEAKNLLSRYGLDIPSQNIGGDEERTVKAQIMANNRKDIGAVRFADNLEEAGDIKQDMLDSSFEGAEPDEVLVEEKIDFAEEYYVSFMYDTDSRTPSLIFSSEGGSGIEDRNAEKFPIEENSQFRFRQILKQQGIEGDDLVRLGSVLQSLFEAFLEEDARLLEVNPLAETEDGYVVLDAMMDLEDDASFRHDWNFSDRTVMKREKTDREIRAEKIDEDDHRGVAGKYTELDGDIGMMLAGGGASLTNMDALIEYGGSPANYTEYGGNPPGEKVYRLSKVIMSKPGLNGLWHVGGTANNTDVERTMDGFIKALREEKPDYPIVIRRDGPHADEAFENLRKVREELNLNMKLFRNDKPMTESAEDLMDMVDDDREVGE